MESRKPSTRARTSTRSVASNRPVYSSHSDMRITSGVATTTAGAGAATGVAAERHPLTPVLAIARYKSHELGGGHLRPGATWAFMSDALNHRTSTRSI